MGIKFGYIIVFWWKEFGGGKKEKREGINQILLHPYNFGGFLVWSLFYFLN
jgi:hypothetical protein